MIAIRNNYTAILHIVVWLWVAVDNITVKTQTPAIVTPPVGPLFDEAMPEGTNCCMHAILNEVTVKRTFKA